MEEPNLRNRKLKTSSPTAAAAATATATSASGAKSTDINNAKDDSQSKGKTPDGTGLYCATVVLIVKRMI